MSQDVEHDAAGDVERGRALAGRDVQVPQDGEGTPARGPWVIPHPKGGTVTPEPPAITLRPVRDDDLPHFFAHQQDATAAWMAAFTAPDPADAAAFAAHWARVQADPSATNRTIERAGRVLGHIASFVQGGETEITYWLDRACWGQGVATTALVAFLAQLPARPLYARAAADNHGSLRVLHKAGFRPIGRERGFAHARGATIEEVVLRLDEQDATNGE